MSFTALGLPPAIVKGVRAVGLVHRFAILPKDLTIESGELTPTLKVKRRIIDQHYKSMIDQMYEGNRLADVSSAIQQHAEANGFSVVRDFVGHGIGRSLHEDPQVPNYGKAGTRIRLKKGMVLAIEPMVNEGDWAIRVLPDGWTAETKDGTLSAHFEHSVAITGNGPDVLSAFP